MGIAPLRRRPAWSALEAHHRTLADVHLRLFADDFWEFVDIFEGAGTA